jgi:hypothetical protein
MCKIVWNESGIKERGLFLNLSLKSLRHDWPMVKEVRCVS